MASKQMLASPVDQGYCSSVNTPTMSECDSFDESELPSMSSSVSSVGQTRNSHGKTSSFAANRQHQASQSFKRGALQPPYLTISHAPTLLHPQSLARRAGNVIVDVHSGSSSAGSDRTRFLDSAPYWLTLYFFFNLSLTLYNKIALVSFPFPWTLTCIHSLSAAVGSYAAAERGYFKRSGDLAMREQLVLIAFSSLYTINIAVSNLSLNLVSVPLHQVVRSTTPIFTMIICIILFSKSYLMQTYLSLVPVIMGVCLATYGDYSFTAWGLFLTLLGAILAAFKGIATNRILVGRLKFHPLDLLLRMSPLAFAQCLVFSYMSGELSEVYNRTFITQTLGSREWISLLVNGAIAFGLNVVSFTANKKVGALSMSVAANVKQVLTIVLAVFIFNLAINGTNLTGIALTIAGGAYYSYVEYQSKQAASKGVAFPAPTIPPPSPFFDDHHFKHEKGSPLPNDSPSRMQDAQMSSRREEEAEELLNAKYHRKTDSLAAFKEFKYPASKPSSSFPMFKEKS